MINRVNFVGNIGYAYQPAFKNVKPQNIVQKPEEEFNSSNAIANYSQAEMLLGKKIQVEPLIPTIFSPNYTNAINGEKIYTSEGKLYSIVDENDKTKTVYTPNEDDTRYFDSIITTDKESGNIVRKQINDINDGKYTTMIVEQFSPETGKITASSAYYNGELHEAAKYIYKSNGDSESIYYNPKRNEYNWNKISADGSHHDSINISGDLKFGNLSINQKNKQQETSYDAKFYNGGLISCTETKYVTIPNLMGREPLSDKDLEPAEKLDLSTIPTEIDGGEKTYYSNGAVESISFPFGTVKYTPEGKVAKLSSGSKIVEILDNNQQTITEKLDNDGVRTTTHYDDGSIKIEYKNDDFYKSLVLNQDKLPLMYNEGNIDEDDDCNDTLSLYYNKFGLLDSAYNF